MSSFYYISITMRNFIQNKIIVIFNHLNMATIEKKVTYFNNTVNSKKIARVLFLQNFADAEFRENRTLAKKRKHSVVYLCR